MQGKMASIITQAAQISQLTFSELYQFLRLVSIFIDIGEDFSAGESAEIREAVRFQSERYLKCFHQMSWNNLTSLL